LGGTFGGAGLRVLTGQLIALTVVSIQPDGVVDPAAAEQVRLWLWRGDCRADFGWAAGALSARFTGRTGLRPKR
jgi:hypothetical protein